MTPEHVSPAIGEYAVLHTVPALRHENERLTRELEAERRDHAATRQLADRLRERIDLVAPGGMTTDGDW